MTVFRSRRSRPRHSGPGPRVPAAEVREAAARLLRSQFAHYHLSLEPAGDGVFVLGTPAGPARRVRLLAAAAPHRRGGRGSLELHWMLTSEPQDLVALVDLSRNAIWLMPWGEFRTRAQPLPGGRFHLDWLVWRLSPQSQVEDEDNFESYLLENVINRYLPKA